jgi:hypothetical protein
VSTGDPIGAAGQMIFLRSQAETNSPTITKARMARSTVAASRQLNVSIAPHRLVVRARGAAWAFSPA